MVETAMSDFSIDSTSVNHIQIIRTKGYLDKVAGDQVKAFCAEKLGQNMNRFVFNLAGSPVINSSGLSKILGILEEILDKNDGKVAVCGLSVLAKTALRTTGLLQLVSECESEDAGVALFSGK